MGRDNGEYTVENTQSTGVMKSLHRLAVEVGSVLWGSFTVASLHRI